MNFREFHTFSFGRLDYTTIACSDLYDAVLAGVAPEILIHEMIVQSDQFHGFKSAGRDSQIALSFSSAVSIAFRVCYKTSDQDKALEALAKFDCDFGSSFSTIMGKSTSYLGRKPNNSLRTFREFGYLLKYSYNIRSIFSEALKYDDLEACKYLLSSAKLRKILEKNLFNAVRRSCGKDAACQALIKNDSTSINDYVKTLAAYAETDNASLANEYYKKELTPLVGHLLISMMLVNPTKTSLSVINKLLSDNADWYMAVCVKYLGPASYFDLNGRVRNPEEEVKHFLDMVPKGDRNSAIKAIWKSIPENLIFSMADNPKLADELHNLTGCQSLVSLVSNKYKRTLVEQDLSI